MSKKTAWLVIDPFHRFFQRESAGGILLLMAAILALTLANSPWGQIYFDFWRMPFTIGFEKYQLSLSLHSWVNDGLMAIFFLLVGLEIKRQVLVGELSKPKQALLPLVAAIGGMVVPALIYLLFNPFGTLFSNGWAIPSVTDIAFSLGILALLGDRVPLFLKVFLAALAIVDDLGAIAIIALFYSAKLNNYYLELSVLTVIGLVSLNRMKVRGILGYIFVGICLWICLLHSGIHPTLAGVLLAMSIPATSKIQVRSFKSQSFTILNAFPEGGYSESKYGHLIEDEYQTGVQNLESLCEEVQAPLQRLEHSLHPWVTFCIMPIFALANAGVSISLDTVQSASSHPIASGIVAGLLIGKTVGIFSFSWIANKLKIIDIPNHIRTIELLGVSMLGGIGFTMSIFIATMSFQQPELDIAKLGIFSGSLLTGLLGYFLLKSQLRHRYH